MMLRWRSAEALVQLLPEVPFSPKKIDFCSELKNSFSDHSGLRAVLRSGFVVLNIDWLLTNRFAKTRLLCVIRKF